MGACVSNEAHSFEFGGHAKYSVPTVHPNAQSDWNHDWVERSPAELETWLGTGNVERLKSSLIAMKQARELEEDARQIVEEIEAEKLHEEEKMYGLADDDYVLQTMSSDEEEETDTKHPVSAAQAVLQTGVWSPLSRSRSRSASGRMSKRSSTRGSTGAFKLSAPGTQMRSKSASRASINLRASLSKSSSIGGSSAGGLSPRRGVGARRNSNSGGLSPRRGVGARRNSNSGGLSPQTNARRSLRGRGAFNRRRRLSADMSSQAAAAKAAAEIFELSISPTSSPRGSLRRNSGTKRASSAGQRGGSGSILHVGYNGGLTASPSTLSSSSATSNDSQQRRSRSTTRKPVTGVNSKVKGSKIRLSGARSRSNAGRSRASIRRSRAGGAIQSALLNVRGGMSNGGVGGDGAISYAVMQASSKARARRATFNRLEQLQNADDTPPAGYLGMPGSTTTTTTPIGANTNRWSSGGISNARSSFSNGLKPSSSRRSLSAGRQSARSSMSLSRRSSTRSVHATDSASNNVGKAWNAFSATLSETEDNTERVGSRQRAARRSLNSTLQSRRVSGGVDRAQERSRQMLMSLGSSAKKLTASKLGQIYTSAARSANPKRSSLAAAQRSSGAFRGLRDILASFKGASTKRLLAARNRRGSSDSNSNLAAAAKKAVPDFDGGSLHRSKSQLSADGKTSCNSKSAKSKRRQTWSHRERSAMLQQALSDVLRSANQPTATTKPGQDGSGNINDESGSSSSSSDSEEDLMPSRRAKQSLRTRKTLSSADLAKVRSQVRVTFFDNVEITECDEDTTSCSAMSTTACTSASGDVKHDASSPLPPRRVSHMPLLPEALRKTVCVNDRRQMVQHAYAATVATLRTQLTIVSEQAEQECRVLKSNAVTAAVKKQFRSHEEQLIAAKRLYQSERSKLVQILQSSLENFLQQQAGSLAKEASIPDALMMNSTDSKWTAEQVDAAWELQCIKDFDTAEKESSSQLADALSELNQMAQCSQLEHDMEQRLQYTNKLRAMLMAEESRIEIMFDKTVDDAKRDFQEREAKEISKLDASYMEDREKLRSEIAHEQSSDEPNSNNEYVMDIHHLQHTLSSLQTRLCEQKEMQLRVSEVQDNTDHKRHSVYSDDTMVAKMLQDSKLTVDEINAEMEAVQASLHTARQNLADACEARLHDLHNKHIAAKHKLQYELRIEFEQLAIQMGMEHQDRLDHEIRPRVQALALMYQEIERSHRIGQHDLAENLAAQETMVYRHWSRSAADLQLERETWRLANTRRRLQFVEAQDRELTARFSRTVCRQLAEIERLRQLTNIARSENISIIEQRVARARATHDCDIVLTTAVMNHTLAQLEDEQELTDALHNASVVASVAAQVEAERKRQCSMHIMDSDALAAEMAHKAVCRQQVIEAEETERTLRCDATIAFDQSALSWRSDTTTSSQWQSQRDAVAEAEETERTRRIAYYKQPCVQKAVAKWRAFPALMAAHRRWLIVAHKYAHRWMHKTIRKHSTAGKPQDRAHTQSHRLSAFFASIEHVGSTSTDASANDNVDVSLASKLREKMQLARQAAVHTTPLKPLANHTSKGASGAGTSAGVQVGPVTAGGLASLVSALKSAGTSKPFRRLHAPGGSHGSLRSLSLGSRSSSMTSIVSDDSTMRLSVATAATSAASHTGDEDWSIMSATESTSSESMIDEVLDPQHMMSPASPSSPTSSIVSVDSITDMPVHVEHVKLSLSESSVSEPKKPQTAPNHTAETAAAAPAPATTASTAPPAAAAAAAAPRRGPVPFGSLLSRKKPKKRLTARTPQVESIVEETSTQMSSPIGTPSRSSSNSSLNSIGQRSTTSNRSSGNRNDDEPANNGIMTMNRISNMIQRRSSGRSLSSKSNRSSLKSSRSNTSVNSATSSASSQHSNVSSGYGSRSRPLRTGFLSSRRATATKTSSSSSSSSSSSAKATTTAPGAAPRRGFLGMTSFGSVSASSSASNSRRTSGRSNVSSTSSSAAAAAAADNKTSDRKSNRASWGLKNNGKLSAIGPASRRPPILSSIPTTPGFETRRLGKTSSSSPGTKSKTPGSGTAQLSGAARFRPGLQSSGRYNFANRSGPRNLAADAAVTTSAITVRRPGKKTTSNSGRVN
jgi:hypothetical protein